MNQEKLRLSFKTCFLFVRYTQTRGPYLQ